MADEPFQPIRQRGLVNVLEYDEREDEQHPCVGVSGSPEILPQRVLGVARLLTHQQPQEAHSAVDHCREDYQEDAGEPT